MRLCGGRARTRDGDGVTRDGKLGEKLGDAIGRFLIWWHVSKRLVFKGQTMLKMGFEELVERCTHLSGEECR